MWDNNQILESIVNERKGDDIDVVRFCLSDQVSINMNQVVEGNLNPIIYGQKIATAHFDVLYHKFYKENLPDIGIPKLLIRNWIADLLAINATFLRATMVIKNDIDTISALVAGSAPNLLTAQAYKISDYKYGGVADFEFMSDTFTSHNGYQFRNGNTYLLSSFTSHVSQIQEPEWILHDKDWKKVFLHQTNRMHSLRHFFHAALVSFVIPEDYVESVFFVDRPKIFSFMSEFIDLRERKSTRVIDIADFAYRLSLYFDETSVNNLSTQILEASFPTFEQVFNTNLSESQHT